MADMLEMFLVQANVLAAKTGTDPYTGLKLGQVGSFSRKLLIRDHK